MQIASIRYIWQKSNEQFVGVKNQLKNANCVPLEGERQQCVNQKLH